MGALSLLSPPVLAVATRRLPIVERGDVTTGVPLFREGADILTGGQDMASEGTADSPLRFTPRGGDVEVVLHTVWTREVVRLGSRPREDEHVGVGVLLLDATVVASRPVEDVGSAATLTRRRMSTPDLLFDSPVVDMAKTPRPSLQGGRVMLREDSSLQ